MNKKRQRRRRQVQLTRSHKQQRRDRRKAQANTRRVPPTGPKVFHRTASGPGGDYIKEIILAGVPHADAGKAAMLSVRNNEQRLVSTDYFDTLLAKSGVFFVSVNAGCFRLLVPNSQTDFVAEMRTGDHAVLTHGLFQGRDSVEIMFEDHTSSPFALTLDARQFDRLPCAADDGRSDLTLMVYRCQDVGGEPALVIPAAYRECTTLPCLKPWGEQLVHQGGAQRNEPTEENRPREQSGAQVTPKISPQVKRFLVDSHFGRNDRSVPVVLAKFAREVNLRRYAIPIEEYIAEQLDHRVVGDLLVLNADGTLTYDEFVGLKIPDSYDIPFVRPSDGVPVYSYRGLTLWEAGASDQDLSGYRAA